MSEPHVTSTVPTDAPVGMPRVAVAIAVLAWSIAVLAVVLVLVVRPPADIDFWFFAVDVMVAIVYGTVAAVALARRRHPVPWILAVTAVGGGLASLGYALVQLNLRHPEASLLGRVVGLIEDVQLQKSAWVPGTLALFLVLPWLIRDHPLRWAWLGPVTGGAVIATMLFERYAKDGAWDRQLYIVTVVVGVLTALAVEVRHRIGPDDERNGLGWLALGTLVMALSFLPLTLPVAFDPERQIPTVALLGDTWNFLDVLSITPALHLVAQALFPAAILVAVLRGRMWGLDLAISRATLSALLTLGLLAVYLLVSLIAQQVISGDGFAHLVSAAAVAVAVQPVRLAAENRVGRLVYGDAAADPAQLVRKFGSQLGIAGSADELFAGLARDLGVAMRLESVTIRPAGASEVRWGAATSEPVVVPLLHRGEEVGTVEVTLPAGESLGTRGELMITEFGSVAATALAVLHQARQVEEARALLTRARLEERRVIRREIHDGLGPSLVGIRLGLQGARNLLGRDDEAAARILQQLQAELDQRVDDVRSLSHSLLPPVLDELGLGPALDELAARHRGSGMHVTTSATDVLAGLEPGMAATAYAITTEALSNAGRHSGATRCSVEISLRRGALVIEVADDGAGIGADAVPGVGSSSMRERAEELGGVLEILDNEPRGTRVRAVLPLQVARA